MAGAAKTFSNAFPLTYVAGLSKENILPGLLWQRHNRTPSLTHFHNYIAPSWSWASVHGRLEYRNTRISCSGTEPGLRISSVNIEEEHLQSFGRVRRGEIDAEGLLQAVIVDRSIHPGVWKKPFQGCGIAEGFVNKTNVICMLDEYSNSDKSPYPCWCLRIGSYDAEGREAAVLLLERVDTERSEYRRVGVAEADPWHNVTSETVRSGHLCPGNDQEFC